MPCTPLVSSLRYRIKNLCNSDIDSNDIEKINPKFLIEDFDVILLLCNILDFSYNQLRI